MMKRTNVVVDEELVERVKRIYRVRTTREAIDLALRKLVGERRFSPRDILDLEGTGWEGDLEEMRNSEPPVEL
jgi:Arc/MetJ family transcription regulator